MSDEATGPQEELVSELFTQIAEKTSSLVEPTGERIVIYPVVLDEDHSGLWTGFSDDLADMGIVWQVSYGANAELLDKLVELEEKEAVLKEEGMEAQARTVQQQREKIIETGIISRGDIVAVNKFAGMEVPGTNFMAIHRNDVLGKLIGVPVRLKTESDRPDEQVEGADPDIVGAKEAPLV